MGDGVRELEDVPEGEGVMLPSSDPLMDILSWSDSSPGSGACLRDERVLIADPAG